MSTVETKPLPGTVGYREIEHPGGRAHLGPLLALLAAIVFMCFVLLTGAGH